MINLSFIMENAGKKQILSQICDLICGRFDYAITCEIIIKNAQFSKKFEQNFL